MKDQIKTLLDEDRAVSPVIGVILMVAITVILAAVIGSMVMGMAEDVGQTTPNANLQTNAVGDGDVNQSEEPVFELEHNGGDALPEGEYEIQLRAGTSGSYTTIYDGATYNMTLDDTSNAVITVGTEPAEVSTGDVIEFVINSDSDYTYAGETVTLQIVHTESDGTITTQEFDL